MICFFTCSISVRISILSPDAELSVRVLVEDSYTLAIFYIVLLGFLAE